MVVSVLVIMPAPVLVPSIVLLLMRVLLQALVVALLFVPVPVLVLVQPPVLFWLLYSSLQALY